MMRLHNYARFFVATFAALAILLLAARVPSMFVLPSALFVGMAMHRPARLLNGLATAFLIAMVMYWR